MGGSSKGGGEGSGGNDYYGSIAGAVCYGPVDQLVAILIDGKQVWPKAAAWVDSTAYTATTSFVDVDGVVYVCTTSHTSSSGTKPPNTSYWTRYELSRVGNANPTAITVEGYGKAYFYWGTDTQALDTTNEKILYQNGHPPYRRQAVLVLSDFLFGRERSTAPNIEVIVKRAPKQSVISGSASSLSDGQANPVASLVELYTDKVVGAGLNADVVGGIDSTTASSAANDLVGQESKAYISPLINTAKSLRQLTAELLAYYDGWVRFSKAGEIEFGRFSHNAVYPAFTAATTIDYNDLIDEVGYNADGFASTYNQTQVKFSDRKRGFKDGAVVAVSGYNLAVTGETRSVNIERPWITRRQQASDHAAEWQKINGEPKISGTLVVRAEKAESINPGDLFLLTHDALSVSMVCKCTGKDVAAPPAGRATLRFENDRAAAPVPYQPTTTGTAGNDYPEAEKINLYQVFQPPQSLTSSSDTASVVVLTARQNALTTGANIWVQQDDLSGYYQLGTQSGFCVYGTLQQAYNPTLTLATTNRARSSGNATITTASSHGLTPGMTVLVSGLSDSSFNGRWQIKTVPSSTTFTYANAGMTVVSTADTGGTVDPINDDCTETLRVNLNFYTQLSDLAGVMQTQTEDAINDGQIFVAIFDQSNTRNFELFTLRSMRIASGETWYRLKVRRSEYGTAKRSAAYGDFVWIGYRSNLEALYAKQFYSSAVNGTAAKFRIQSFNAVNIANLSDAAICPDISFTFADLYAPQFEFLSVKANGAEVTDFATYYPSSTSWDVQGRVTDASGDLIYCRLYAKNGSIELPIWQATIEPTSEYRFATKFTLPYNGTWEVRVEGKDSTGRTTSKQLTQGGTSSPDVYIQTRSATDIVAPTASPSGGGYTSSYFPIYVILKTAQASAAVKWKLYPLGSTAPSTWSTNNAWIEYLYVSPGYRLESKTVTATSESAVVYWDFWQVYKSERPSSNISTTAQ